MCSSQHSPLHFDFEESLKEKSYTQIWHYAGHQYKKYITYIYPEDCKRFQTSGIAINPISGNLSVSQIFEDKFGIKILFANDKRKDV